MHGIFGQPPFPIQRINHFTKGSGSKSRYLLVHEQISFMSAEIVFDRCISVMARNFSQLYASGASFDFLPLNLILQLLSHPSLAVQSEYSVGSHLPI